MTRTTATASPTAVLGDELVRVSKVLHAARTRAPRKHPLVDPMAYPLLFNLRVAPVRVSALAELVHTDVSTVSRQVSTLVELGLVAREPDPDDGRAHVLAVTPEGETLLSQIRAARDTWLRDVLADWTDDDVRACTASLSRLADDLETHLSTPRTDR